MLHSAADGRERHRGGEQVRVAVHREAHHRADVAAPVLGEAAPLAAADVDAGERARTRVEAGGQHDHVELGHGAVGQLDAVRGDAGDRVVAHADEVDVVAEVDLEVVALERYPVGAEAVVGGDEHVAQVRVVLQAGRASCSRTNSEISSLTSGEKNISPKPASHSLSEPSS